MNQALGGHLRNRTMSKLIFPSNAQLRSSKLRSTNEIVAEQSSLGQRAADHVAAIVGSWPFILIQSTILLVWVALNITALVRHWDPYPFILMNLVLSLQAAFTAPIIMMSQNRQSARDRIEAHNDFLVNQKAEEEIRIILENLAAQNEALAVIHQQLAQLEKRLYVEDKEKSA